MKKYNIGKLFFSLLVICGLFLFPSNLYTQLMRLVITTEEYCEDFTYGIYQIEKEIDTTYHDARGNCQHNHGDVQNLLKTIKNKAKDYYVKEIAPVLLKYELVK